MPVHRHKKRTHKPPATANGYPAAAAKQQEEVKARAQECKAAGNEAFAKQDWLTAIGHFSQAIALDSSDHVFYSNRSAANLALKRTGEAVDDARDCVRLAPTWVKGYSRLGAALWADRQLAEAEGAYQQGLRLEQTEAMQQSLKEVQAELATERVEQEAEAKAAPAEAPVYDPVVGIDLGTTYSAIAVWDVQKQGVVMLHDDSGSATVPSYVGWSEDGERIVGERAKQLAARAPGRVLYDVKRLIGRKIHEVKDEILPFEVVSGEQERTEVRAAGKTFVPEQVSAMVLARMKEIAEARLGRPVTRAVVTVPAYFNDAQRKATQAAGAIAGLEVLRIINEPTAAALGYGLDQKEKFGRTTGADVLVFDFGGGTFDVSVLRIEDGIIEVKATGGDTRLGGEDIDQALSGWLLAELKQRGHDVKDAKLVALVRRAAECAKRDLSTKEVVTVELPHEEEVTLSRAKFEELAKPLFERCLTTVKRVLADAKLEGVDDIVLVGGSTRIPYIQEALVAMFGQPLCKSIHPDEAVAYGAAVQGAILSGVRTAATTELLLIDVTPLSLGIGTEGRHMSIIIPRNTSIPCTKTSTYTTIENYQEEIDVPVYEGERPCTDQNRLLGEFQVKDIERAKKGEAHVDVTFSLDANGVLNVLAQDKKTKSRATITISDACKGLDPAEIARMVQEAEACKEEDAEYAKKLEVKAELEDAGYERNDEELLEWLDGLVLSDTSLATLTKKRREMGA